MKIHIISKNMIVIELKNCEYLQSYSTLVGYKSYNKNTPITIAIGQPQSTTTARQLTKWIGESYKTALKSGRAIYGNILEI